MKVEKINDIVTKVTADEGKVLRRIADGLIAGKELWLGYTYYDKDGKKLDPPLHELPEHYEEIDMPEDFDKEPEINEVN